MHLAVIGPKHILIFDASYVAKDSNEDSNRQVRKNGEVVCSMTKEDVEVHDI